MENKIRLLLIETGTTVCSVAVSLGRDKSDEIVVREPRSHAKVIGTIINEILERNSLSIDSIDGVVVSEGPGSYTGLRVGVSIAKGICYGAGKPLIAINSLLLLARLVIESGAISSTDTIICPLLDARRDEVYAQKFDSSGNSISQTEAVVLDGNSFKEDLDKGAVIFAGDGAAKASKLFSHTNATFLEMESLASGMIVPAFEAFAAGKFVDTAYFEPFYLKDFIVGTTKKRLF